MRNEIALEDKAIFMSEETNETIKIDKETWDQENLLAFFKLLLEVDRRLNPQNYEVKNDD